MSFLHFFALSVLILSRLSNAVPHLHQARQTVCNGNAAYCDRIYSDVSFVGSHDSAFVGILPSDNEDISLTDQMNLGIRFLQGQTHKNSAGAIEMCHTSCILLDAGSEQSYLGTVKSFLDANPNEVITLLIVNGDKLDVSMFDAAFTNSGIKEYAFVPSSNPLPRAAWPTIGEMISSGKRLVVFMGASILCPASPAHALKLICSQIQTLTKLA
jgi:hypothetical protein